MKKTSLESQETCFKKLMFKFKKNYTDELSVFRGISVMYKFYPIAVIQTFMLGEGNIAVELSNKDLDSLKHSKKELVTF